jgi:hypothetical protein
MAIHRIHLIAAPGMGGASGVKSYKAQSSERPKCPCPCADQKMCVWLLAAPVIKDISCA